MSLCNSFCVFYTMVFAEKCVNGLQGDGKRYQCGVCWENFDEEADIKCHIFTRHICKFQLDLVLESINLLLFLCILFFAMH